MFIKTILKDSKKVRRIRNYVSKWNPVSVFLDIAKFADFLLKMLMLAELKGYAT